MTQEVPMASTTASRSSSVGAMAGGFVGKAAIAALVRRYRAAALITLLLGGLIAVSVLATTAAGVLDLHAKTRAGRLATALTLRWPCAAGGGK